MDQQYWKQLGQSEEAHSSFDKLSSVSKYSSALVVFDRSLGLLWASTWYSRLSTKKKKTSCNEGPKSACTRFDIKHLFPAHARRKRRRGPGNLKCKLHNTISPLFVMVSCCGLWEVPSRALHQTYIFKLRYIQTYRCADKHLWTSDNIPETLLFIFFQDSASTKADLGYLPN